VYSNIHTVYSQGKSTHLSLTKQLQIVHSTKMEAENPTDDEEENVETLFI